MSTDNKDEMVLEVPTDEDLFNAANADEPETPVEAQVNDDVEPQVNDVEEKVEAAPEQETPSEQEPDDGLSPQVRGLLKEIKEERGKRQQLEGRLEQIVAQQAHAEALRNQQATQQEPEQMQIPDPIENPEFYQEAIQQMSQWPQMIQAQMAQQMNQQLAMQRHEMMGEFSLQSARQQDPETFNAAWQELERRSVAGDNTWRHAVLTSQDAGQTLLELYKREKVAQDVGTDPDAYVNRRLEELKKDPKFLQEVLEAAQQQGGGEAPKIDMPSLNRAGGSGSAPSISGRDLWDRINS